MPLVFSYGTLQQESVQLATFGRRLSGEPDELPGFYETKVPVFDPAQVEATGLTHYANAAYSGKITHSITGTALEISDDELVVADHYEQPADYVRIKVSLASGRWAWVYVHRPSAPGEPVAT